jgi:hypothetical protein
MKNTYKTAYITMSMDEFKEAIDCGIVEEDFDKEALEWQEEEYGGVCIEIVYEKGEWVDIAEEIDVFCHMFPMGELITDRQLVDDIQSGKVESDCCYEVYACCYGEDECCYISTYPRRRKRNVIF